MSSLIQFILFGVAVAAIGAGVYFLKRKQSPTPAPIPVPVTGWAFQYSPNMPAALPQDPNGNYYIDFPAQDGVHYVIENPPAMTPGQLITMRYSVSGVGTIYSVQDGAIASVTLYMQRKGDDLSGVGPMQQYRYFGKGNQLTGQGDFIITCQLAGDQWGDVFGSKGTDHPAEFAACIANAGAVGFVFGNPGAGATGHGAAVKNGTARLTLKEFSIK